MRIIIDGDATPSIGLIENIGQTNGLEVIIFCDFTHAINSEYSKVVTVDKGFQNVDMVIMNNVREEDIVITQDYGLAAIMLAKKCFVINPSGNIYTEDNIDFLLQSRYLNLKSKHKKGPKKRTLDDDKKLIESIEKVIYGSSNFRNNTRNS